MVGLRLFPPPGVFVAGENSIAKRKKNLVKYKNECSTGGQFWLCVVVVVVVVAAKGCDFPVCDAPLSLLASPLPCAFDICR